MTEYEEDFTLKDLDIKSKSFWQAIDKKKLAYIAIISLSIITLFIIVLSIVLTSKNKNNSNKFSSVGDLICEYDIKDTQQSTFILGKEYIKTTELQIIINGKEIKYNKEHKFDEAGINTVIFKVQNNINMDLMFKDVSSLKSINLTSTKNAKITSMISTFENCENLDFFHIDGFDTSEVKSMHKLFYKTSSLLNMNLSLFKTDNVIDMSYMFSQSSIQEIDFSNNNIS